MTKMLSIAAFVLGTIIVIWMGTSFMGSNLLAFVVTCAIAVAYAIGFVEQMRFQGDTQALNTALENISDTVTELDKWLSHLPATLRSNVRLRIQGEYVSLPMPILTPYLVGLLVMLGLLGTFVGMVDTLKGAVFALQGTTELEAIRAGLTAPIKGLGLAFGTSVAGVSASAVLGFISTLSRRQRALSSRLLDQKTITSLQNFSLNFHREQAFKAMQEQAQALPAVAQSLSSVVEKLEYFTQNISQQLATNQEQFHQEVSTQYKTLATSVDSSLKNSLSDSSRILDDNLQSSIKELQPLLLTMVTNIREDLKNSHSQLNDGLEQRFNKLAQTFTHTSTEVAEAWQQGLSKHQNTSDQLANNMSLTLNQFSEQWKVSSNEMIHQLGDASQQWITQQETQDQQRLLHWHNAFEQSTASVQKNIDELATNLQNNSQAMLKDIQGLLHSTERLVESRRTNEDNWLTSYESRMHQLTEQVSAQLTSLRNEESRRGELAVEQLKSLNAEVEKHLQRLGAGLEAPMTRLIESASETPRAAAEVISQLRAEISNTIERDNQLLVERQQIFEQLTTVANALQQSSAEHNEALQILTNTSADTLKNISTRFSEQVNTESTRLSNVVDHVNSSSIELASLGDAFSTAVEQFGKSSQDVSDMLTLIEESLQTNAQRSDEQMAYYIAQAKEIIDHNVLSQQELIEQLRQISRTEPVAVNG